MNEHPITLVFESQLQKLADYIYSLHPDLKASEIAAIVAYLIGGLPAVIESSDLLKLNIHGMATIIKHKRQQASDRN